MSCSPAVTVTLGGQDAVKVKSGKKLPRANVDLWTKKSQKMRTGDNGETSNG